MQIVITNTSGTVQQLQLAFNFKAIIFEELDITNLAKGYYLVTFTSKNFSENKRFTTLK
jgi:hypothetical protein